MGQSPVRVRQNVFSLSAAQKANYVQAVLQLKKTTAPGPDPSIPPGTYDYSVYDWYVLKHKESEEHRVHYSPWFLPWHRQFILDFENALRLVADNPETLAIPYWDWAGDPHNSDGKKSAIWADDFMGPDGEAFDSKDPPPDRGGDVVKGPFRKGEWTLKFVPDGNSAPPTMNLRRGMGRIVSALPTPGDVNDVLKLKTYDSSTYNKGSAYLNSFRNALEGWTVPDGMSLPGLHNRVHAWVGGSMADMPSPNDPVFYLHHSNVDRIWAQWQDQDPGRTYAPTDSVPDKPDSDPAHKNWPRWAEKIGINDPMWPWTETGETVAPADVWNYKNLGYVYDTLWPALPPAMQVPLTPVPVGPQWASDLLGPGWGLIQGSYDPSTQAVNSFVGGALSWIHFQGPATAQSSFSAAVRGQTLGGNPMCQVYLCLRGPGAFYQHPVMKINGQVWSFFQIWNGESFADNPLGWHGNPVPNGDCWFRIQPVAYPAFWEVVIQAGVTNLPFKAWAYLAAPA